MPSGQRSGNRHGLAPGSGPTCQHAEPLRWLATTPGSAPDREL